MAETFDCMVEELEASRGQIEAVSRNLETMVEARTAKLRRSAASLLEVRTTVIANVGTGVLSLDERGRVETSNGREGTILGPSPERRFRRSTTWSAASNRATPPRSRTPALAS